MVDSIYKMVDSIYKMVDSIYKMVDSIYKNRNEKAQYIPAQHDDSINSQTVYSATTQNFM